MHAGGAFVIHRVRAEAVVELGVGALADEPVVERPQHGAVRIGIVDEPRGLGVGGAQPIADSLAQLAVEEPGRVPAGQTRDLVTVTRHDVDAVGTRNERPHDHRAVRVVRPEDGERIAVPAVHDGRDRLGGEWSRRAHRVRSAPARRARFRARIRESPGRTRTSPHAPC